MYLQGKTFTKKSSQMAQLRNIDKSENFPKSTESFLIALVTNVSNSLKRKVLLMRRRVSKTKRKFCQTELFILSTLLDGTPFSMSEKVFSLKREMKRISLKEMLRSRAQRKRTLSRFLMSLLTTLQNMMRLKRFSLMGQR